MAALDLLLSDLDGARWGRERSIHDLLRHLATADAEVAAALAAPNPASASSRGLNDQLRDGQIEDRRIEDRQIEDDQNGDDQNGDDQNGDDQNGDDQNGDDQNGDDRDGEPEAIRRVWWAHAERLCASLPGTPGRSVNGTPIQDALAARAFETWIHREDIATVIYRPTVTPLPEHLHPMADLAIRILPLVTAARVADPDEERWVRAELTGPGGGIWMVPLLPGGDGARQIAPPPATGTEPVAASVPDPAVTVVLDVVDFGRLAAGRRDPNALSVTLSGDTRLGLDWLAAVPAVAATLALPLA
ncbi:hypothetical protein [Actinoplanes sp. G11-F43]|uniref:hypothetical protein n=1 Tax=Actinoplanes sp. G11-F43 TaxID=3424130 RepID=UPI003D341B5F